MEFETIREAVSKAFKDTEGWTLEYFEIAEVPSLEQSASRKKNKKYRAFIAAKLEGVRLIDSIALNE